jgi:hypothetical protein
MRPGSVSVQSGYKMAASAKKPRQATPVDMLQLVESD